MRQNKFKNFFLTTMMMVVCFSFWGNQANAADLPQSDYNAYMLGLDTAIKNDPQGDSLFLYLFGIAPKHPYTSSTGPDYPDKLGSIVYETHNDGTPLASPATPASISAFASSYIDGMKAVYELDQHLQAFTSDQRMGFVTIYGSSVSGRVFSVIPSSPSTSPNYVKFLYDTVSDPNNYKTAGIFIDNFEHAWDLLKTLRQSYTYKKWGGTLGQTVSVVGLDIIKILTKINIPNTGNLQQITTPDDGNDLNEPNDLSELFGLMYASADAVTKAWTDPLEFMQDFIRAAELLQVLSENSGEGLASYAALTGVYIRDYNVFAATGSVEKMTQYEIDALFGMMFYADGSHSVAYDDPYGFLDGLDRATALLDAIQDGGETAISQIFVLTGADFSPANPMNPFKTSVLFGLMYDNTGTPTLAYTDPVAYVNALLNDDNIYYVTALYEKLKEQSAIGYYNQIIGTHMTTSQMATGDFQFLIDNLYGRVSSTGDTLESIIALIGGSVVDVDGNNVDDRIDAFIAEYVSDVKTLTPKANTLYDLLVSNNAFETFNMVTGSQLISTGTRPKDYQYLFSSMFNANGTHTDAYDLPQTYIDQLQDLVTHSQSLFDAINSHNAFDAFNSITSLNINANTYQTTLLGVSFGAATIGSEIISPEWSGQFARFIHSLAQLFYGNDQQKYEYYMNQYNSLITDVQRYYNQDNVAPYAVYRDGAIYVGPTGHGWATPNAEGGLASAYLGLASVGYNPFILGGGVSLTEEQQAKMYSYFSYFAGQANPSNGLIKTFYNPQGGQWQQEIMCSSYDLSLMIIGGSDALASKLITTLSTNGISASGGVLNNLWYDSSLVLDWEGWDWAVTGGNNAWVGIASIQYSYRTGDNKGLDFARNIANFLLTLQDADGGMRMGPKGLWHDLNYLYPDGEGFYWNTKSLENNESILAFFDLMYEMTGEAQYKTTADQIYGWMKNMYDSSNDIFHRGMRYDNGTWKYDDVLLGEDTFATDTISWLPIQRMVEDAYFGATSAERIAAIERIYQEAFQRAGVSYSHLPKEVYEKMFGLMFDIDGFHTDAYDDPDQYVIDLIAYINNEAELQAYYDALSADQKSFWAANFTDPINVIITWADDPATPAIEPDYNYAAFVATFDKAYQLYVFYMGLSSAQKTQFTNLYGTDMFVIVTMMYD
ncbi:MAG: hypothetical protein PHQ52_05200, partial [Candidatus Omnitrophica bacterium]|nr:hypothetical protein [Candidatus Omnitrophota bacterium]